MMKGNKVMMKGKKDREGSSRGTHPEKTSVASHEKPPGIESLKAE